MCQGVHVFPDTDETRQLVAAKSGSIFFYLTEVGSSVMKGYVMIARKQCKELFKGGWCLKAEEAWTVALPKSEAITVHILNSPLFFSIVTVQRKPSTTLTFENFVV